MGARSIGAEDRRYRNCNSYGLIDFVVHLGILGT